MVIPLYNGADHLKVFLAELIPVLEKLQKRWEILFVDDHSNDNGFQLLEEYKRADSRIRAIRLLQNAGQQNAVYCGLCHGEGSLLVTMDDDLQHPPKLIPELIERISGGYDLVYGVNRDNKRRAILRAGTWVNGLFFSLFIHKPWSLEIGSYRIMTRDLVNRIRDTKTDFVYVSALIFRNSAGLKVQSFRYIHEFPAAQRISRINLLSRMKLFVKLFVNYGPFRGLKSRLGDPFLIERRL